MIKKLLAFVLLASPVLADEANFALRYDLDSTSVVYCKVTGNQGNPFGGPISGAGLIKTSGSSATTTEVADTDPFADNAAGDVLLVDKGTVNTDALIRIIITDTSASSNVVDAAWDIENGGSGYAFRWLKQTCGTGAENGWIDIGEAKSFTIGFELDQVNVTGGVDVQVQCRGSAIGASPTQVFPACASGSCNTYQNYTTAGIASATFVQGDNLPVSQCRVGIKIGSADDGSDTGADKEQIDITLKRQF